MQKLPHYYFVQIISFQKAETDTRLLDDLKENRKYWNLKEEALDRIWGESDLEEAVDLSQHRIRNE